MVAQSCHFRSILTAKFQRLHRLLFHSFCLPATPLDSSFGQSKYSCLDLACFRCRTLLHKHLHSQRRTILNDKIGTTSILFASLPISFVLVTCSHFQFTMTLLQVVFPLAIVDIPIGVFINSMI